MQADIVTGGADLCHAGKLPRPDAGPVGEAGPVLEDDLHAKAEMGPPCYGLANPPHTDDAKRLAGHLPADKMRRAPAAPGAGAKFAFALAGAAAQHQHQGQRQIGGGIGQHTRRVADSHALRRGGGKIDMVHPDAVIGDHPAAPRGTGRHHIGIDHVRYSGRGDVMAGKAGHQIILAQRPVIVIESDIEMGGERLFRRGGPAAGYENRWSGHGVTASVFDHIVIKNGGGAPQTAPPPP